MPDAVCRLLGVVSRGPIYYDLFEEFADLAVRGATPAGGPDERGHRDGWGLALFRGPRLELHARGTGSARDDPQYYKAAWQVARINAERDPEAPPLVLVAHLRRASAGTPVDAERVQPFVAPVGDVTYAFAHNGTLADAAALDRSDSMVYFEAVRDGLGRGETVPSALAGARQRVATDHGGATSLTALLARPGALTAFREYTERGEYYTLYTDDFGELVLFASEPILGMKDDPVPRGWSVTVDTDLRSERQRVA